jgi:putative transposase
MQLPTRPKWDAALMAEIRRVYAANFGIYCVWKVWRQLARKGITVARCTVGRLMRAMGLESAVRGRKVRTPVPDPAASCSLDQVNQQFKAKCSSKLWVADCTYVATWGGFVYATFVTHVFARRIVGWRLSRQARADVVLDALDQALHERRPVAGSGLVCHSECGS